MRKQKLFILGGRSGTTLMQKLLMATGEFTNWHNKNITFNTKKDNPIMLAKIRTQVPYGNAWEIYKKYPDVPMSILDKMDRFDLAKLPEFDLIVDLIIKKYKNPLFLILERDVESRANSHMKSGMGKDIKDEVFKFYKNEFKKVMGKLPTGDWFGDECLYWEFMDRVRESKIKDYEKQFPENILRINFNAFMNRFRRVMIIVSNWLDINPIMPVWNRMRKVRTSLTTTNVTKYIKGNKEKEIVPEKFLREKKRKKKRNNNSSSNNSKEFINIIKEKTRSRVYDGDKVVFNFGGINYMDDKVLYIKENFDITYAFIYYNLFKEFGEDVIKERLNDVKNLSDDVYLVYYGEDDGIEEICNDVGFRCYHVEKTDGIDFHLSKCFNKCVSLAKHDIFFPLNLDCKIPYNTSLFIKSYFLENDITKKVLYIKFFNVENETIYGMGSYLTVYYKPLLIKCRGWDERIGIGLISFVDTYIELVMHYVFDMDWGYNNNFILLHKHHKQRKKVVSDYEEDFDPYELLDLLKENIEENKLLVRNSYF